ncbi:MAG: glycosyltransferase [Solirubrobacterales bacterium]
MNAPPQTGEPAAGSPVFSVVVPTIGRPRYLEGCLAALTALDYPSDRYEVVVVNDGGGAPIADVIARFSGELNLCAIEPARTGPSAARNAGAAAAAGTYIAFTDDDCEPEPDWLGRLERQLAENPGAAVGGRTVNGVPDDPRAVASQTVVDALHEHFNRGDSPRFFASSNLAVPAAEFDSLGGFAEHFRYAEDREICERWSGSGRELVAAPEAVVRHMRTLTPREFARQHYGYGRGAWAFARTRESGVTADRSGVVRKIAGSALAAGTGPRGSRAALLAASQLATAAGIAREAAADAPVALVERLRGRAARDGRAAQVIEPLAEMLTMRRGSALATLRFVRHNGLSVSSGPFAGMRYPRSAVLHWPDLGPRLAGTYEAELHPVVEEIVAGEPALIVNIGAGEGYYAVGLAQRCRGTAVIAYEADPYDAQALNELAAANGVAGQIEARGFCDVEGLAEIGAQGAVVICDCEGAEADLVDLERVSWLRGARLLIEAHESYRPGLTEELEERLAATHEVERIEPAKRYLVDHPDLLATPGMSPVQLESVLSELRFVHTPWLWAVPREGERPSS